MGVKAGGTNTGVGASATINADVRLVNQQRKTMFQHFLNGCSVRLHLPTEKWSSVISQMNKITHLQKFERDRITLFQNLKRFQHHFIRGVENGIKGVISVEVSANESFHVNFQFFGGGYSHLWSFVFGEFGVEFQ